MTWVAARWCDTCPSDMAHCEPNIVDGVTVGIWYECQVCGELVYEPAGGSE